jgi:hypothetical protein
MADIYFEVDGERVPARRLNEQISSVIRKRSLTSIASRFEQLLRNVRCPEHGTVPTVVVQVGAGAKGYELDGCCDACIKAAEAALDQDGDED